MPRERQLPLGVAGRVALGQPRPFRQRYFAIKMRDEMGHAMRAHNRQREIKAPLAEPCRLLQRAGFEHGIETRIDPRLQRLSFRREEDREDIFRIEKRGRAGGMESDETSVRSPRKLRGRARCVADRSAAIAPRLPDRGA